MVDGKWWETNHQVNHTRGGLNDDNLKSIILKERIPIPKNRNTKRISLSIRFGAGSNVKWDIETKNGEKVTIVDKAKID